MSDIRRVKIGEIRTAESTPPPATYIRTMKLSSGRIVETAVSLNAMRRDGDEMVIGEPLTADELSEVERNMVGFFNFA